MAKRGKLRCGNRTDSVSTLKFWAEGKGVNCLALNDQSPVAAESCDSFSCFTLQSAAPHITRQHSTHPSSPWSLSHLRSQTQPSPLILVLATVVRLVWPLIRHCLCWPTRHEQPDQLEWHADGRTTTASIHHAVPEPGWRRKPSACHPRL